MVFEPESAQADCVWIESIHSEFPAQGKDGKDSWILAWDHFLLRANEHRDAARRHLRGSLILAAPPRVKPRARDAAPDLWSIRSLVLDLTPMSELVGGRTDRGNLEAQRTPDSAESGDPDIPVDIDFVGAEIERTLRIIRDNREFSPEGLVRGLGRAVAGHLYKGETRKAVDLAREAVDLLRARPRGNDLLAEALTLLSEAVRADGDIAASADQLDEAVMLRRNVLTADGETSYGLRGLAIGLNKAGDVRTESGDLEAATSAFEESLAICRRVLDVYGETSQALRDLAVSLERIGDIHRGAGELKAATSAFEESLALDRQLLDVYGETPQALRDLSISLNRMGAVHRATGDLKAATSAFEESLALRRRLLEVYGEATSSAERIDE